MKLPEPLKQINFHPPQNFFFQRKKFLFLRKFFIRKTWFSTPRKIFYTYLNTTNFPKKKKKSYTCLKKILIPLRKRKIPNQKNLPEKTIFQTKTFLYLSKKLIYYTRTRKLNGSILVIFWTRSCFFFKLAKLNSVYRKLITVLVCARIYIKKNFIDFFDSRWITISCPRWTWPTNIWSVYPLRYR